MSDEKPLHVRVAEALGWDCSRELHQREESTEGYSACVRCGALASWAAPLPDLCVPRYDTDWCATGPLIERLLITVAPTPPGWEASSDLADSWAGHGPTPLIAVCNLILELYEAGIDGLTRPEE